MGLTKWSLHEGASLLTGVEKTARLLIAEMDKRLADRGDDGKVAPDTKGIVVVCIMTCAYFCEIALKTLHSSLNEGVCSTGHDLEKLYEEVEQTYVARHAETAHQLEQDILKEMKAYYAKVPENWWPSDIRSALKAGANNFTAWRYGYPENTEYQMGVGVPRHLFAVATGIFIVCLKQNPSLWGEPGEMYLLPDPEKPYGEGFSVVRVE